jgi:hypothetical protein
MTDRAMGPRVLELIAKRAGVIGIPPGTKDALGDLLKAIQDPELRAAHWKQAKDEMFRAIDDVRSFGVEGDDEKIALLILERSGKKLW